jgi:hypothetical protein
LGITFFPFFIYLRYLRPLRGKLELAQGLVLVDLRWIKNWEMGQFTSEMGQIPSAIGTNPSARLWINTYPQNI